MQRLILTIMAAAALGSGVVHASKSAAPEGLQSHSWYDGTRQRQVWIDPELVAEFAPAPAEAGIQPLARQQNVRIRPAEGATMALARNSARVSPVLRDFPGGPMRALPGNVIVQLDPAWGEARIEQWLAANRLTQVGRMPIRGNYIIVGSPSGLESLRLAGQLRGDSAVLSAQPEWWQAVEAH